MFDASGVNFLLLVIILDGLALLFYLGLLIIKLLKELQ